MNNNKTILPILLIILLSTLTSFASAIENNDPSNTEPCNLSYTLLNDQWRQIVLPCNPGSSNSITDVFGDDMTNAFGEGVSSYANNWILFKYDSVTSKYIELEESDILEVGVGYWIIQLSGNSVSLSLPTNSTPVSAVQSSACPSDDGCFELPLNTRLNDINLTMIGRPSHFSAKLRDVKIQASATTHCSDGCSLDTAETDGLTRNQLLTYDGNGYTPITSPDGIIEPWVGYWVATLQNADGSNPKLLIPKINVPPISITDDSFTSRVVASGLLFPYEVIHATDGNLWVTERTGKRVTQINPTDGTKRTLLTLSEVYQSSGQDGLLGMALHPGFLNNEGTDFVYLAYTYSPTGTDGGRKLKIVRYTYNEGNRSLSAPLELMSGLSASNDHNAGRLVFGDDEKLYYAIGDQGANQFANKCVANQAQSLPTQADITNSNWNSYQGKVLRLNIDGSIPADNPIIGGIKSHIFSYGHRNPQGLVFANGLLFSAEHGPKTDDEINIISAGGNYGWPHVAGFQDNRGYEYCNWSSATDCSSLNFSDFSCPVQIQTQSESNWVHIDFVSPSKSLFVVDFDFDFLNPPGGCTNAYICWPTIAPSSISHYNPEAIAIPGWDNSLLLTSLKKGKVYRVKMDLAGNLTQNIEEHWYTQNRYRDIAVNTNGTSFFVATDTRGRTSGPSGGDTTELTNPGAILEFSYLEQ